MANLLSRKYVLSSLILLLVLFSDQVTKFQFSSSCNSGFAFSFLESKGRLNIFLSFVVLMVVFYFLIRQETKLAIIAVSLVLAGGLSNFADRIGFGCVRDFIDLNFWPSFNLADSVIVVGVAIGVLTQAFKKRNFRHG